jgi:hypothetical protein
LGGGNMSENFKHLSEIENFEISPCDTNILNDKSFKQLNLTASQKSQMSYFTSQVPSLMASGTMANAYIMKIPDGFTKADLMKYANGGLGTPLHGANGRIADHAQLFKMSNQAIALSAFSVLSMATGQYFLTQINTGLDKINQKIDEVMSFLYGDKKAELVSELNFIQYAYKNFSSIMTHKEQRVATLSSLQKTRKVAIKDIEFYLSDLETKSNSQAKSYPDFEKISNDALQIQKSLELAMQLYIISTAMEMYYAQNNDKDYVQSLKSDLTYYLNKCNNNTLKLFSQLKGRAGEFKPNAINKFDSAPLIKEFVNVIDSLAIGEKTPMMQTIETAFGDTSEKIYYFNSDGDVFLKTIA